jgi:uncharacterized membrane protein YkvI
MIGNIFRVTLLGAVGYAHGRSVVQEFKKPAAERNNLGVVVSTAVAGLCACAIGAIISPK